MDIVKWSILKVFAVILQFHQAFFVSWLSFDLSPKVTRLGIFAIFLFVLFMRVGNLDGPVQTEYTIV